MITFERCKEIFSDEEKFVVTEKGGGIDYTRVELKRLANNGEHYDFGYRKMPNGFNDVAEVFFGKWEPMCSYVCCHNICDEQFLLTLIDCCYNEGRF